MKFMVEPYSHIECLPYIRPILRAFRPLLRGDRRNSCAVTTIRYPARLGIIGLLEVSKDQAGPVPWILVH